MGRGSLLLGAALRPNDRFSLELLAGGGLQNETRDVVTTDTTAANLFDSTDSTTLRGEARLRLRHRLVPRVVSVRLRGDASTFSITRSSLYVGHDLTVGESVVELRQTEVSARAYVDLDAASFLDLSPGAFAGVDAYSVSGSGSSVSTTVPVFGVALSKPWM